MRVLNIKLIIVFVLLFGALHAHAQESLQAILDRGFVENWFVAGPFDGPADRDIVSRVAAGDVSLDDRDHLQIVGGLAGAHPQDGAEVPVEGGIRRWQQAASPEASLDLSPLFAGQDQGVAYLTFYTTAAARTMAFFDLQSPLGVRMVVNGVPVRDVRGGKLEALGVEQFIVAMRPGQNVVSMAVPLASFTRLAEALTLTPRELMTQVLGNRTALRGRSGFEISLMLSPVEQIDEVYVVPRVRPLNTFSGVQGDVRQDAMLSLFNGSTEESATVQVLLRSPYLREPTVVMAPAIAPGAIYEARIAVPLGNTPPGDAVAFTLELTEGDTTRTVESSIVAADREEGGKVYVVTGHYYPDAGGNLASQVEKRTEAVAAQLALAGDEQGYGFHIGAASEWLPVLHNDPALREALFSQIASGYGGTHAGYARPDPRVAGGALLLRDISLGQAMAKAFLRESVPGFVAWNLPGLPPRIPAMLAQNDLTGTVTNIPLAGIPALSELIDPQAPAVWLRRKEPSPFPATVEALQHLASLQRTPVLDLGVTSDVLVLNNPRLPPEPLFFGATDSLRRSFPVLQVGGNGTASFLRDAALAKNTRVPETGMYLNNLHPGDVVTLPETKAALGQIEHALLIAERQASLAGLLEAPYPHAKLDHAWRQLLFWSSADRFTRPGGANAYLDLLVALRGIAATAREVQQASLAAIAAQINTDRAGLPANAVPVAVFNPSGWTRSDVCELPLPQAYEAFTLQDDVGDPVSFHVLKTPNIDGGPRVRFVATGVPPLGHRTFYIVPGTAPARPVVTQDPLLENDRFQLELDPGTGDIVRLRDKRTGEDYASGPLNRIISLAQEAGRRDNGRELWTTGKTRGIEGPPVEITRTLHEDAQELKVTSKFAGGTVTRTLRSYDGVDRIDATVTMDGLSIPNEIVGLHFPAAERGNAFVFGERLGNIVGAHNAENLLLQTRPLENVSGTAAYPALQFAAMSPGDTLRVALNKIFPLGPVVIIPGDGPLLAQAAETLQRAFVQRSIPAQLVPYSTNDEPSLWKDDTHTAEHASRGDMPSDIRILIGPPEQNVVTAAALQDLPTDALREFYERLPQGVVLLIAPTQSSDVPTVIISGSTSDQCALLARAMAEAISVGGSHTLPESQYVFSKGSRDITAPESSRGLAILFHGARLAAANPDGSIFIALQQDDKTGGAHAPKRVSFDYALYPHTGSWREANINRVATAFSEPFIALRTEVHRGPLPSTGTLLNLESEGQVLVALRPPGYAVATLDDAPPHPRDGLYLTAHDGRGQSDILSLTGFPPLQRVIPGKGNEAIPERRDNTWRVSISASAISTFHLTPDASRLRRNPAIAAARDDTNQLPQYAAYWREGQGVAPEGGLPLALSLEGSLADDATEITLKVANLRNVGALSGTVKLEATEGLSIGPLSVPYILRPGEILDSPIKIMRAGARSAEFSIAASTEIAEQTYRIVLRDNALPLEVVVGHTEAQLSVRLKNPGGIMAAGRIDLIVPVEFWGELWEGFPFGDPVALLTPASRPLQIVPYGIQTVYFRVGGADPRAEALPWAVARVAVNGQVTYHPFVLNSATTREPQGDITPPGPRARPTR